MRYALVGYGRMGRAIEREADARGHVRVAVFDRANPLPPPGTAGLAGIEVAFEFTAPAEAERNVLGLLRAGVPAVCGTTGWTVGTELREAARSGGSGCVVAPNFALGVQLFYRLVADAAARFGRVGGFEPFVFEQHHSAKADVPSGTGRRLADLIGAATGTPVEAVGVRAGWEPGTHVVGFDGAHEVVRLEHRARDREVFARGAVLAAEWIAGRTGIHAFEDVVADLLADSGRAASAGGTE